MYLLAGEAVLGRCYLKLFIIHYISVLAEVGLLDVYSTILAPPVKQGQSLVHEELHISSLYL